MTVVSPIEQSFFEHIGQPLVDHWAGTGALTRRVRERHPHAGGGYMELIAAHTRIGAEPAQVLAALTTTDGFRHWWTEDADVGREIGAPATFRFGKIEVTFLIDRIDRHGIEMTCVDHKDHPEWLDTHLAFRVLPDGAGAYVDMLHDGYRDKHGCYARCIEEWTHYLKSLRAYCETGSGTPHTGNGR